MRLVDNDDIPVERHTNRLARALVQQDVVRHHNHLGGGQGPAGAVVGACSGAAPLHNELLDILHARQHPIAECGHARLAHERTALFLLLLQIQTFVVHRAQASQRADGVVDAEGLARAERDNTHVAVRRGLDLPHKLRELRVRAAAVENLSDSDLFVFFRLLLLRITILLVASLVVAGAVGRQQLAVALVSIGGAGTRLAACCRGRRGCRRPKPLAPGVIHGDPRGLDALQPLLELLTRGRALVCALLLLLLGRKLRDPRALCAHGSRVRCCPGGGRLSKAGILSLLLVLEPFQRTADKTQRLARPGWALEDPEPAALDGLVESGHEVLLDVVRRAREREVARIARTACSGRCARHR
eukprot:m.67324 g.67324  ORF g.67324 m.67324 type:complete len:357 (+) comp7449_c0_seq1:1886-2956(+)